MKQHGRPELNMSFENYRGSCFPFPMFTCVAVSLPPSYQSLLVVRSGQHGGEHGHERQEEVRLGAEEHSERTEDIKFHPWRRARS